jgi:hypothetical protein
MINYAGRSLFARDGMKKSFTFDWGTGNMGNSSIVKDSFVLSEKLTSNGKFKLGDCNAAQMELQIGYGTIPLEGKTITVSMQFLPPSGTPPAFTFGKYNVVSDVPTADRRFRKITAYDDLYYILKMDVTEWYDTILPDDDTVVTIKQFRDSFFSYVGVTQKTQTLINDTRAVRRVDEIKQLSGKQVLNALCEVNACFGHIDREGKFAYVYLLSSNPDPVLEYSGVKYEDFTTSTYTKVIIRSDKNDMGVSVGTDTGNAYVISGNFLTYKMSWEDLTATAAAVKNAIAGITYEPAQIETKGDPCREIGDCITVGTKYKTVTTYIMQRKIKGVQWLKDSIISKGEKNQQDNINSTSAKINEISGRINEIKADLVTATTVLADEIEAAEARIDTIEANYISAATVAATYATITDLNSAKARIGTIEANYITAGSVAANYATISSLDAVSGRVGTLESTAITTGNLSAQSISGGQINSGTIDTARLNVGTIAAQTVTLNNICGALNAPGQGTITIGTVRTSSYQYFTGQGYTSLSIKTFTVNGTTYRCLGY